MVYGKITVYTLYVKKMGISLSSELTNFLAKFIKNIYIFS